MHWSLRRRQGSMPTGAVLAALTVIALVVFCALYFFSH